MSVSQMNTTEGVVERDVLLDQSNYARFRDFLKTKMVDEKVEDEAVEICFRVAKTVEMVEFTTPAGKEKVVEDEEARQKANKNRVDLYANMPEGTPTHILEKSKVEGKLADDRKKHSLGIKEGFTMIGNLLRKYIAPEMQATLNAATYDLWNAKCGEGTWDKMEGGTLAWIVSCYFASGSAGKPHLEYKLRNLIMMTAGMQASDPFEISIQLEKIRKLKMELEAEKLTADQIIEAIYREDFENLKQVEGLKVQEHS